MDLDGAEGVELSVAADCGVLGGDCDAMDVILAQELVAGVWDCREGVELFVATDCGVLGEDCDAMDVILAQELVGEVWDCRKGVEWQGGRGLQT